MAVLEREDQELVVDGKAGPISIKRDEHGIPVITARDFPDAMYGLGLAQAFDRGMQMELTRLVAKGRMAEHLPPNENFIAMDKTMRKYDIWGFSRKQAGMLERGVREEMEAFCRGVNDQFRENPPAEFALISYVPEPWAPEDCIAIGKIMSIVDMDETQGWIRKVIVQMVQRGVTPAMLAEIFTYMTEDPDEEYLDKLRRAKVPEPYVPETVKWAFIPRERTSSHWMVAGTRTETGKPILCGSPELDTARLPALWQEVLMCVGDFYCMGVYVPGIPLPALGRTNHLSWSATYSCMDVMDYFLEEVKDGKYRRGEKWLPFEMREEIIKVKDSEPVVARYYENVHGVLEGEPVEDGYYLSLAISHRDAGALTFAEFTRHYRSRTVMESMDHLARCDALSFNWGLADSSGNIGYQMSGRCPVKPDGWRGVLPLPGWDEAYDWKGFHPPEKNPRLLNPEKGFFGTSNQDLNYLSDVHIQTMPMSDDRAARVAELLAARDDHSVQSMMKMQYDVYGKHAEWTMPLIRHLLPEEGKGGILREWDLVYSPDSVAASVFENVYYELLKTVFGDYGVGREVIEYVLDNSELFYMYYGQLDHVLHREDSLWFGGKSRDEVFAEAVARGLEMEAPPFGETRKVVMKNLVYGDMVPDFNYGPIEIIGSRGTVSQGAIFKAPGGRIATFSPTIRFICDMSTDRYYSCLAGGPSEKPSSPLYASGVEGWLAGDYKLVEP
ncbi:MAG: penicillin acylase family protein [Actinobacteria bacterium]|nr:penicillin acylase family protein [Actinomycetota bacterium]